MAMHPGMALLVSAAAEAGLRKRAGFIFTLGEGPQIGWLGLNTASFAGAVGEVLVHPVMGVRNQVIEDWVARGCGKKLHGYIPPTLSEPLRYLVPSEQRRDWILDGGADDRVVVADLMEAVRTAGMEFISRMGDLDALSRALGDSAEKAQQAAYRWPVSLYLAGNPDAALRAIVKVRAGLGQRDDLAADELRKFLTWFEGEVRAGG